MTGAYDNRSFLSGIAVGRQLKGWSASGDAGGGGGGTLPTLYNTVLVPEMVLAIDWSQLSPVANINAKLVPESVFDVTDIVE